MEVNTMEKGEINDVIVEEVVMEDMDYTKIKNKVIKPKKRVAGERKDLNCDQMRNWGHNLALQETVKKTKEIFKRWRKAVW
jgi:hypothetical protein